MPELEQIPCEHRQVLLDAESSLDHVFFPDSGVVSVVAVYADGSIIEMATIGREGCTGFQAILGAKEFFRPLPRPDSRNRSKDVARGIYPGIGVDAIFAKSNVRLCSWFPRTGTGLRGVQRCAQPQGAVSALAAHDA
jgi:hypothetical protein